MTPLTMTLLLAWRDPIRQVALAFGVCSILFFAMLPPSNMLWSGCFIAPAFFLSVALTLPTFSAFELSLPITREQLLWSRVIGSLAILWAPLLAGTALWMYAEVAVRQPIECALQFTASACLFTFARLAPRRAPELACAALAALCATLALLHFTLTMALVVGGAAAFPMLAKIWWTYVPDERDRGRRPRGRSADLGVPAPDCFVENAGTHAPRLLYRDESALEQPRVPRTVPDYGLQRLEILPELSRSLGASCCWGGSCHWSWRCWWARLRR